jgi:hypothetical protein
MTGALTESYRRVISSGTSAANFAPGLYIGKRPEFQNPPLPTLFAGNRARARARERVARIL